VHFHEGESEILFQAAEENGKHYRFISLRGLRGYRCQEPWLILTASRDKGCWTLQDFTHLAFTIIGHAKVPKFSFKLANAVSSSSTVLFIKPCHSCPSGAVLWPCRQVPPQEEQRLCSVALQELYSTIDKVRRVSNITYSVFRCAPWNPGWWFHQCILVLSSCIGVLKQQQLCL
jgi:hypothetical protein